MKISNLSALSLENYCSSTARVSSFVKTRLKHELLDRKDCISQQIVITFALSAWQIGKSTGLDVRLGSIPVYDSYE